MHPPRTEQEWAAAMLAMHRGGPPPPRLHSQVFVHYRNKKRYLWVNRAQIQMEDRWYAAAIYREEGCQDLYVRPLTEFIQKFRRIDVPASPKTDKA